MRPQQKKGKEELIEHLRQLNATWIRLGISFNREFIPYAGTFCIIKVFDPSMLPPGLVY